mgnify:CR=1 FL=1
MVSIDKTSGFCFGVIKAIQKAEEELQTGGSLYCLGEIVHNEQEVKRLANMGLITIDYKQFSQLHNVKVLLRAHGEPPSTYETAKRNNIEIIDATCPVVSHLQNRIREKYLQTEGKSQIVIYGTQGHAEVVGLAGQADNHALIVEKNEDIGKLDFDRDIYLYSQTTKSIDKFNQLTSDLQQRMNRGRLESHNTICRQVANRTTELEDFARQHDIVIFVGGKKSSNAKVLFSHCLKANPRSYFVSNENDINVIPLSQQEDMNIGICGATSTPLWLMEKCRERVTGIKNSE